MSEETDTTAGDGESPHSGQRPGAADIDRRFGAGAADVAEWNSQFVIRVDLPGVENSGFAFDVTDSTLEIVAKRDTGGDVPVDRYLLRERTASTVTRSISLPGAVDGEELAAEYADGVLTVKLPRDNER